jgi:hypothetical protein
MKALTYISAAALVALGVTSASGQDGGNPMAQAGPGKLALSILLDRPVKAGELTLFADQADPKAFYYVLDKPRLATNANGTPQFSFLRWVDNKRPTEMAEKGGGIIHAVVAIGVSEDQLQKARGELQSLKPGAKIVGPAMFAKGKFALVAAVTDKDGKLAHSVLGVGSAPLLDGQKAAVSIRLTELGAKVLWESFKTPTPDISFSFEMELTGLSSPFRATLTADFEKVYKHQAFQAGFAHTYLGGEVNLAFEDLRRTGAIKLTQVGTDPVWEGKLTSAYGTLTDMMFDKAPEGQAAPAAAPMGDGKSMLERATDLLKSAKETTTAQNMVLQKENEEIKAKNEKNKPLIEAAEAERKKADAAKAAATKGAEELKKLEKDAGATPSDDQKAKIAEKKEAVKKLDEAAKEADTAATAKEKDAPKLIPLKEEKKPPTWALLASYKLKKERKSGSFTIDLNKYSPASITMRFDENIGDLRRLMGSDHFREVNIDHPLYQEREVVAYLDGLNSRDFDQYINFVTFQLRKKHAMGDVTDAEVRIDRGNFNANGSQFKTVYGWKNDNDRRAWLDYEYRTVWSFFGGRQIESPWQKGQNGAVQLVPPFQPRTLKLYADPELVKEQGIRAITVKLFFNVGGGEQVRQLTLNTFDNKLTGDLKFMLPWDTADYAYEAIYQVKGNRTLTTGRQQGVSDALVFDVLPK